MADQRMVKTYLDEIPWGTEEDIELEQQKSGKERRKRKGRKARRG